MKKFISLLLVCLMVVPFGMLATTGVSAEASVWDGKAANIKWYTDNASATEFTISKASELNGLSVLCWAKETTATPKQDQKVYYDANGDVILDASKITETTASVSFDQFLGKTIKLAGDIDLAGKPFTPIGSSGSFQGTFDGQNHTISNVTINAVDAAHKGQTSNVAGQYYYGLFAFLAKDSCGVKNLTIVNEVNNIVVNKSTTKIWAGAVMGTTLNNVEVSNVKVEGYTANISVDGEAPAKLELYLGACCGVYKSTKNPTVTVTDFSINGKSSIDVIASLVYRGDSLICGANTSTGSFDGCSVTEGVYVPETPSQPSQPDQPGDTPSTGDMTWVVAVIAAVAVMGSAVVLKKREN